EIDRRLFKELAKGEIAGQKASTLRLRVVQRRAEPDAALFEEFSRRSDAHPAEQRAVAALARDFAIVLLDHAAGKDPRVRNEARVFVAADHQHLERCVTKNDHARGGDRVYFCHPTHSSPSGPRSFFQIGTVCFTRSIIMRHAVNDSPRCGDEQTIAIDESPTLRWPR